MHLIQNDITKTKHYVSVSEIQTKEQEKMWIEEYKEEDDEAFSTLVEMFESEVGHPKYEYEHMVFAKTEFEELELFVASSVDERIDLHVKLEPGEKAVLYGLKNDNHPFWNEVMLLLLLNTKGEVEKTFFFNDEYYDLYHNLEETKEEYEETKRFLIEEEGLSQEEAEKESQEEV